MDSLAKSKKPPVVTKKNLASIKDNCKSLGHPGVTKKCLKEGKFDK